MTTTPAKSNNPNDAKSAPTLGKPTVETKTAQTKISLKAICAELKLDPRIAREKLRLAAREPKNFPELAKAHKPRQAWEWQKGSQAEREARAAVLT